MTLNLKTGQNVRPPSLAELQYLGFRLTSPETEKEAQNLEPFDIEHILFKLCVYLGDHDLEGRLAGVLVSWIKVHGDRVFVDRLRIMRERYVKEFGSDIPWLRYLAYYSLSLKRHNWKPLTQTIGSHKEDVFYLIKDQNLSKAMLQRWGIETFLPHNSALKIHRGALRVREEDVLEPAALMKKNIQYANRYRYGANVRADVITHMESMRFDSPTKLSKFLGLSREAVRKNWEDYQAFISARGSAAQ